MNIEGLSLDQMRVALAVASTGSFSAAARQLRRAQSAVSYAITTLENQLGTELFDRSGPRTRVAPEGSTLLAEMAAILAQADALKQHAKALSSGQEPVLHIVVDALFDLSAFSRIARELGETFAATSLSVEVESMQRVLDRVGGGHAHLGLLASLSSVPAALRSVALSPIQLVPVAKAGHPILTEREFSEDVQHNHVQIILGERGDAPSGPSYFVFASRTWRATDLGVKHALLLDGAGWGYMPLHRVADDLQAGRLVRLELEGLPHEDTQPVFVVWSARAKPGPCARWLIERLSSSSLPAER